MAIVFLSACGSSDEEDGSNQETESGSDPTVTDLRFDGGYVVTEIVADGSPQEFTVAPTMTIDAVNGGLTVMGGCNTHFGSFTLGQDGQAGFTVTGGTKVNCVRSLLDQDQVLLDSLAQVDRWQVDGDGYLLSNESGTTITIQPA